MESGADFLAVVYSSSIALMRMLKRFLVSRKVVLAQLLLLLSAVVVAYLIPQQYDSTPAELNRWQALYPTVGPWVRALGVDHVYTSAWFAALLGVFLLSLVLSTFEQFRLAFGKTSGPGSPFVNQGLRVGVPLDGCRVLLKRQGYRLVWQGDGMARFIRYRSGYWGNALLHAGLVVTIASSLVVSMSLQRGRLLLIEDELYQPEAEWAQANPGLFSGTFALPEMLRIDEIVPEYWETDEIRQLTSRFTLIDREGQRSRHTLAINRTVLHNGIRYYQGRKFGHAFFLVFHAPDGGTFKELLMLGVPPKKGEASYGDFAMDWTSYAVAAKYYTDVERRTMVAERPQLVLRMVATGTVLAETTLLPGERGRLGPYEVELAQVERWGEIIYAASKGMPGVFWGFAIIIGGSCIAYFAPPREILLSQGPDGLFFYWKALRFTSIYEQERDAIVAALTGERPT